MLVSYLFLERTNPALESSLELLSDSSNSSCITWRHQREFKLTDPDEWLAGGAKGKANQHELRQTQQALRYYYDKKHHDQKSTERDTLTNSTLTACSTCQPGSKIRLPTSSSHFSANLSYSKVELPGLCNSILVLIYLI
ncbi:hypothetical protein AVEN_76002-1 [Araneus ventricosus]|uniref:ETS domain-containing protein n=1 Tax=Araneus ventricosus TaxID=182803 RepID=A0A4Y2FAM5_ARAVE|nr:hypothetical protein AVEN_76002-1 [Araneus ventricosus]